MKAYLVLTPAEDVVYTAEIEKIDSVERKNVMDYLNEWEQRGFLRIMLGQLKHRFGALAPDMDETIRNLPDDQLIELSEALLDFKSIDELNAWVAKVPHA